MVTNCKKKVIVICLTLLIYIIFKFFTLSSMQCQLVEMSFTAGRPLVATAPSFFSMSVSGSFGLGGRPRPLLIGSSLNFDPRRNGIAYNFYDFGLVWGRQILLPNASTTFSKLNLNE